MGLYGGASDGGAAAQEKARQAKLDAGMGQINDIFSKYGNDFYQQRGKDYLSYAEPQVMEQYRGAKNNLAYALARNGNMNSSAAVNANNSLNRNLAQQNTTVANAAQDQENQLRGDVENQRTNLTNQLIASGDPSTVAENAAAATAGLRAPGAFQPLGNLFSDWTQTYLSNINAKAYNPAVNSLWSQLGF